MAVFANLWERYAESKKLNFAKAVAGFLAKKLGKPIRNSKRVRQLREFVEKDLGISLKGTGGDVATILAKTLFHVPEGFVRALSVLTGVPVADLTVVTNQFLDELAETFFENESAHGEATIEKIEALPSLTDPLTGPLAELYRVDVRTGLIHTVGCRETQVEVTIRKESGDKDGGKGGKGKKPETERVWKLKDEIREITLKELLHQGYDPAKSCDCCGGVSRGDRQMIATAPKQCIFLEALDKLTNEQHLALSDAFNAFNGARSTLDSLNYEELIDYLQRPIWTLETVAQIVTMWNPGEHTAPVDSLQVLLGIFRMYATPKARPKEKPEGKLDRFLKGAGEVALDYLSGDMNQPATQALRNRVKKISDDAEKRAKAHNASAKLGARLRNQGR